MWNPDEEGITHINAYSKSRTRLGTLLSNFYHISFVCEDGYFQSIEGYWYWLIAPEKHSKREELRKLYGFRAKQLGREICSGDWRDDEEFKTKIKRALWYKVQSSSELKQLLLNNTLPIVHYYSYGQPPKIVIPEHGSWIWEAFNLIRKHILDRQSK